MPDDFISCKDLPCLDRLTRLQGVGLHYEKALSRVYGPRIIDLLLSIPLRLIDRRIKAELVASDAQKIVSFLAIVERHAPPAYAKTPYRLFLRTAGDVSICVLFFRNRGLRMERKYPAGTELYLSGRIACRDGLWTMIHPDFLCNSTDVRHFGDYERIYPLGDGLTRPLLRHAMHQALHSFLHQPPLAEWMAPEDAALLKAPAFAQALIDLHSSNDPSVIEPTSPCRKRLAYDSALAFFLSLLMGRKHGQNRPGPVFATDADLDAAFLEALSFKLTSDQSRVMREIAADVGKGVRMCRLLQGDVGTGKTVLAFYAAYLAIRNGAQAVLLAPTEVLAWQHHEEVKRLAEKLRIVPLLLTGKDKGKQRLQKREAIAQGQVSLVISTHAVLEKDVRFAKLGLIIIDEQHRFGVEQRLRLSENNPQAHLLSMSATPIPRSLHMLHYGDMLTSRLHEKPGCAPCVDTRLVNRSRLHEVYAAIRRRVERGDQIYWVCPALSEGDASRMPVLERYEALRKELPGIRIALLHGRLGAEEKRTLLHDFREGGISLLVATTVIEVGVDAPDATLIVIENAERFGLAQLHQLRGRVGRKDKPGLCLLLFGKDLAGAAKQRLSTLRSEHDGFVLAETDLRLRGPGSALGEAQSGYIRIRMVDPQAHEQIKKLAFARARHILEADPYLQSQHGKHLRLLLGLMGYSSRQAALLRT